MRDFQTRTNVMRLPANYAKMSKGVAFPLYVEANGLNPAVNGFAFWDNFRQDSGWARYCRFVYCAQGPHNGGTEAETFVKMSRGTTVYVGERSADKIVKSIQGDIYEIEGGCDTGTKPSVELFCDIDNTLIPGFLIDGRRCFTREAAAEVLFKRGFVEEKYVKEIRKLWGSGAPAEQIAPKVADVDVDMLRGKKVEDAVRIISDDLAPMFQYFEYVMPAFAEFRRKSKSRIHLVTNVYDFILDGLYRSGKLYYDGLLCSRHEVRDGKFTGRYEVDISLPEGESRE